MKKKISKYYQNAFRDLANALIFIEPIDWNISHENIRMISDKIQKEFMWLDTHHQKKLNTTIEDLFSNLNLVNDKNDSKIEKQEKKDHMLLSEHYIKMEEREFLKEFRILFSCCRVAPSDIGYYGWGFTPKLSMFNKKVTFSCNCFGTAVSLGSYFRKKGLRIAFGITVDHPYVVVYIDNDIYITDSSKEIRLHGTMDSYSNYEVYYPAEDENMLHQMMMIFDFDHAILYEILENMEVLRQLSLGEKKTHLPNTYDLAMELIAPYKKIIEKINWKDLQVRLFPDMVQAFEKQNEKWSQEILRVADLRRKQYIKKCFDRAVLVAFKKANVFMHESTEIGVHLLFVDSDWYRTEISKFLREGTPFPDEVWEHIRVFFTTLKEELEKEKILIPLIGFIEKMIGKKQEILTEESITATV